MDALGFGILIPIVPLLFVDPSSSFYLLGPGVEVKTGYILLGLLTAIFPLMQFFSASIFGELSDKFGRRKILMYTLFGTSLSYILFALGILLRSIPLLFIARALAGITSGNLSVAQASIADITEPKDRAKNFGLMGAAFGLGFILGPFLGGKLSDPNLVSFFSPSFPFYFAAGLSLINAISVKFNFGETNQFRNEKQTIHWGKALVNIAKAFQFKNLRFLYLINFLFFSGFTFFVTFFSVFLLKKFGFNQGSIGDLFSFFGLWMAFTQAVLTRKVASYFNEAQVLKFTIALDGVFIGLMYFAYSTWMLYALIPFISICNGLAFSNLAGLISRSADQKIQGEVLGINASVQALAQLIPPVLSGFIAASFSPETPMIVASGFIIFSGVLFALRYKPTPQAHIENY